MNLVVIGGSGFLGSFTVKEAVRRGYAVTIITRRKGRSTEVVPRVEVVVGDIYDMSKAELGAVFSNQDAVVYALGLDDRQMHDKPVYKTLHKDHVDVCLKVMSAARESGVKKFVVFGSYFTYFDRRRPELGLSSYHPYIRTRREQYELVTSQSAPGFDTFVLEIPYIFGSLPGIVPAWVFILNMLTRKGRWALFFSNGGTAAVTPKQIAEAAIGAIEMGKGGAGYPIGGLNISWKELSQRVLSILGAKKKVLNTPAIFFFGFAIIESFTSLFRGKARGLNLFHVYALQNMDAYVDPLPSMNALGYAHDDYDSAISNMVKEWKRIAEHEAE